MSVVEPRRPTTNQTPPWRSVLGWEVSRRKFGVVVGVSTASIAVAWGYGVAAQETSPAKSLFWAVRVVRAGRGARLTADGSPAFHSALGPTVFSGQADRAANSAIVGLPSAKTASALSAHADGHGGGQPATTAYPQPVNLTWGDVVVIEVEARNTAPVPLLFSPGQLRLRLANGPTITPQDASRGPEPIAAGSVERLWVSYLAPSDAADFSVEFTDPRGDGHLVLPVPGLVAAKA